MDESQGCTLVVLPVYEVVVASSRLSLCWDSLSWPVATAATGSFAKSSYRMLKRVNLIERLEVAYSMVEIISFQEGLLLLTTKIYCNLE